MENQNNKNPNFQSMQQKPEDLHLMHLLLLTFAEFAV
jgi:hypothetical protein